MKVSRIFLAACAPALSVATDCPADRWYKDHWKNYYMTHVEVSEGQAIDASKNKLTKCDAGTKTCALVNDDLSSKVGCNAAGNLVLDLVYIDRSATSSAAACEKWDFSAGGTSRMKHEAAVLQDDHMLNDLSTAVQDCVGDSDGKYRGTFQFVTPYLRTPKVDFTWPKAAFKREKLQTNLADKLKAAEDVAVATDTYKVAADGKSVGDAANKVLEGCTAKIIPGGNNTNCPANSWYKDHLKNFYMTHAEVLTGQHIQKGQLTKCVTAGAATIATCAPDDEDLSAKVGCKTGRLLLSLAYSDVAGNGKNNPFLTDKWDHAVPDVAYNFEAAVPDVDLNDLSTAVQDCAGDTDGKFKGTFQFVTPYLKTPKVELSWPKAAFKDAKLQSCGDDASKAAGDVVVATDGKFRVAANGKSVADATSGTAKKVLEGCKAKTTPQTTQHTPTPQIEKVFTAPGCCTMGGMFGCFGDGKDKEKTTDDQDRCGTKGVGKLGGLGWMWVVIPVLVLLLAGGVGAYVVWAADEDEDDDDDDSDDDDDKENSE